MSLLVLWPIIFFYPLLLALTWFDWRQRRLPDWLTLPLILFGFVFAALQSHEALNNAILSAICGSGAFWLIRIVYFHLRGKEGLGFGDVKLMAGIGAWLPLAALPTVVLIACIAALVMTIGNRAIKDGTSTVFDENEIPLGSYLVVAAMMVQVLPFPIP